MSYQVLLAAEAEEDVFDIYRYVMASDGRDRADYVLGKLQATCQSLSRLPRKGHVPPELERVGVRGNLEVHFQPYRIIYQVVGRKVFVLCVVDGRRAFQDVLERRLLR